MGWYGAATLVPGKWVKIEFRLSLLVIKFKEPDLSHKPYSQNNVACLGALTASHPQINLWFKYGHFHNQGCSEISKREYVSRASLIGDSGAHNKYLNKGNAQKYIKGGIYIYIFECFRVSSTLFFGPIIYIYIYQWIHCKIRFTSLWWWFIMFHRLPHIQACHPKFKCSWLQHRLGARVFLVKHNRYGQLGLDKCIYNEATQPRTWHSWRWRAGRGAGC